MGRLPVVNFAAGGLGKYMTVLCWLIVHVSRPVSIHHGDDYNLYITVSYFCYISLLYFFGLRIINSPRVLLNLNKQTALGVFIVNNPYSI